MKLNETVVEALPAPKVGNKIYYFPEALVQGVKLPRGFGLRVTAGGTRSFILNYRVAHREGRYTIGQWPDWNVPRAVKEARTVRQRIDRGDDPLAARRKAETAGKDTLKAVAEEYLTREGERLRTGEQRRRTLERLIYPAFGDRQIDSIKRSEIIRLLDKVEDENGARMADDVLFVLGRVMRWHESRTDEFRSPVVRGMRRTKPKERARSRTLTDDELRLVWHVAGDAGVYGAMLRFIVMTSARIAEAAEMIWAELDGKDWTLPAARNKTKVDLVRPLSDVALATLPQRIEGCPFVFSRDGRRAISGFNKNKKQFDVAILEELRKLDPKAQPWMRWTTHDLRRSARSLMSRAGVPSDHAEQCLGHVLLGVRGTYDRYAYYNEKKNALERLAAEIARTLNPPPVNVTPLRKGRAR